MTTESRLQLTYSVVLSFYNEERVIPELLSRLRAVFGALQAEGYAKDFEFVFVNDASTDGSEVMLTREAREHGDVVLVNMSRNFGVSECVMAGMTQARGDAVIYMDADLQDPPEVIPEMVRTFVADPAVEVVYTTRRTRAGEHPAKMALTKFGYRFVRSISEIELPVDSGDFKLLSRRAVDELLKLQEKKPYIRGLVSWMGFKQASVLYDRDPRFDGRENTKYPVLSRRVIYGYLDRALISFSDAPLKASLFFGFGISFVSFLYLLVVFLQKFMGWHEPGWPALMAAIVFLGGIQITILGIIGLYISTIFQEVKRRPNFIIRDVVPRGRLSDAQGDSSIAAPVETPLRSQNMVDSLSQ